MNEERRKLAWATHRSGDLRRAEEHYRALLETGPIVDDAVNLCALLRQQGRLKEAAKLYGIWLKRFPDDLQFHLNASNCLHELRENEVCVKLLRDYLQRHPAQASIKRKLARSLTELRNLEEAQMLLLELTQTQPSEVDNWMELGLCYHRQEKKSEALNCFKKVSLLEPEHLLATANQITIFKDEGRYSDCRKLIDALPQKLRSNPEIRGAIAGMYMKEMDMKAAARELAALCNDDPNNGAHWLNLAASLRSTKHINAALKVLKRGLCRAPEETDLKQALGQCLAELGKPEIALPILRQSAGPMEKIKDEHLFNIQFNGAAYHLIAAEELQTWARSWEQRVLQERGLRNIWADMIRQPANQRRLRIGYLSADWCNHPVCRFMLPVLENHDRTMVEVWGISSSPHHDQGYAMAKERCDHWFDLEHATDLEMARVIADIQLDVLIELGGYTGHSRITALLHRPAPVQLSYLGYFAPTYLKAIDGWIGDHELFGGLERPDEESQTLWMVEGGYMAYRSFEYLPACERSTGSRFRFGSFNHSRKLNPETIRLYAKVMRDVPNSDLVLKSVSFVEEAEKERVMQALIAADINSDRIVLLPTTDKHQEHLALYKELDLVLDPIPYGGATSTCDALIMGVPVVSLAGQGMVGRLSSSILASAGLEQWIARSEADYRQMAKNHAMAGPVDQLKRNNLRNKVQASALCDVARLCSELERIYRKCHQESAAV